MNDHGVLLDLALSVLVCLLQFSFNHFLIRLLALLEVTGDEEVGVDQWCICLNRLGLLAGQLEILESCSFALRDAMLWHF